MRKIEKITFTLLLISPMSKEAEYQKGVDCDMDEKELEEHAIRIWGPSGRPKQDIEIYVLEAKECMNEKCINNRKEINKLKLQYSTLKAR